MKRNKAQFPSVTLLFAFDTAAILDFCHKLWYESEATLMDIWNKCHFCSCLLGKWCDNNYLWILIRFRNNHLCKLGCPVIFQGYMQLQHWHVYENHIILNLIHYRILGDTQWGRQQTSKRPRFTCHFIYTLPLPRLELVMDGVWQCHQIILPHLLYTACKQVWKHTLFNTGWVDRTLNSPLKDTACAKKHALVFFTFNRTQLSHFYFFESSSPPGSSCSCMLFPKK